MKKIALILIAATYLMSVGCVTTPRSSFSSHHSKPAGKGSHKRCMGGDWARSK